MRHMDQVTIQPGDNRAALQMSAHGVSGQNVDSFKIFRKLAYFTDLLGWPQQKIFVFAIKPRQRANNVARVSAHAELIHPANVDGNLHIVILLREGTEGHRVRILSEENVRMPFALCKVWDPRPPSR